MKGTLRTQLSFLLVFVLILMAIPFQSVFAEAQTLEEELLQASNLGICELPISQEPIQSSAYMEMLDRFIALTDDGKSAVWAEQLPYLRSSNEPLQRMNAFVALYLAAETVGGEFMKMNTDWTIVYNQIGESSWETYIPNADLFGGSDILMKESPLDDNGWQRDAAAYFYSFGRISMSSQKPLFDYDPKSNSMRPADMLTVEEAALAIYRLYDSSSELAMQVQEQKDVDVAPTQIPEQVEAIKAQETVIPFDSEAYASEIDEANALGLFPDDWSDDLSKIADAGEYAQLIIKAVKLASGNENPTTVRRASGIEHSDTGLTRMEAATFLYKAALENYYGISDAEEDWNYDSFSYSTTLSKYHDRYGGATPCMDVKLFNEGKTENIDLWACVYVSLQIDYTNEKTIMDLTADGYLRTEDMLTRGEAVIIAKRIYSAYISNAQVPLEDAQKLAFTLSDTELAHATEMPICSWNDLPAWRGTGSDLIYKLSDSGQIQNLLTEDDFSVLAEFGFNYKRIQTYDLFQYNDGKYTVYEGALKNLDYAIHWGIKSGIHITLCQGGLKGFAGASFDAEGFYDAGLLDFAKATYGFLAERYKDVPSNALSFNLFNEPWELSSDDKTAVKAYIHAVRVVSDAIREFGEDRLIIVDGLDGSQTPIYELAKDHVAQAFHMYAVDHFLTVGWQTNDQGGWYVGQHWPLPYVSGRLMKENWIKIKGEFTNETEVSLFLLAAEESGLIEIYADGQKTDERRVEKGQASTVATLKAAQATEIQISWIPDGDGDQCLLSIAILYNTPSDKGTPLVSSPWYEGDAVREMIYERIDVINCDYTGYDCGKISFKDGANPTIELNPDGTYTCVSETGYSYTYDINLFKEMIKPWVKFSKKTGVDFAVLEWGPYASDTIAAAASYSYMSDGAKLMYDLGVAWCVWVNLWDENRLDVAYVPYGDHMLDQGEIDALRPYLDENKDAVKNRAKMTKK